MNLKNLKQAPPPGDRLIHKDGHVKGDDPLGHMIGGSKKDPSGNVGAVCSSVWLQLRYLCVYAKFLLPLKSAYILFYVSFTLMLDKIQNGDKAYENEMAYAKCHHDRRFLVAFCAGNGGQTMHLLIV